MRRTYLFLGTGELRSVSFREYGVTIPDRFSYKPPPESRPLPGQILPGQIITNPGPNAFGTTGQAAPPPTTAPFRQRPSTNREVEAPPYFEGVYLAVGDAGLYAVVRQGSTYELHGLGAIGTGGTTSTLYGRPSLMGRFERASATELRSDKHGSVYMGRLTSADSTRSYTTLIVGMTLDGRIGSRLVLLPDEIQGTRR